MVFPWPKDFEWFNDGLLNTDPDCPIELPLSILGLDGVSLDPLSLGRWGGATYLRVFGFITGGSGFTLLTVLSIDGVGNIFLY